MLENYVGSVPRVLPTTGNRGFCLQIGVVVVGATRWRFMRSYSNMKVNEFFDQFKRSYSNIQRVNEFLLGRGIALVGPGET